MTFIQYGDGLSSHRLNSLYFYMYFFTLFPFIWCHEALFCKIIHMKLTSAHSCDSVQFERSYSLQSCRIKLQFFISEWIIMALEGKILSKVHFGCPCKTCDDYKRSIFSSHEVELIYFLNEYCIFEISFVIFG